MTYCPRCGVVLASGSARCPLCGAASVPRKPPSADSGGADYPPQRSAEDEHGAGAGTPAREEDVLSSAERRRIAVELLSVAFGIGLAVSILADLFANRRFSWSRYSSSAIVGVWLVASMPLIFYRRPWLLFATLAPSLTALVFLMDAFDGRISWFLGYGLPIAVSFAATSAGVGALVGAQKRKGLNVVALFLCGAAVVCIALETTLDFNLRGALSYGWSVIVAFALVPTAAILFYLHYRVVNRATLRKLFRL